jgi:transcriptional regulator with XRE-family HTH domain
MNYNQRIRDLREDNDLNQTEVATILHVGQTTYSDYEKGKVRMPIEHLITLAKFYDVNLDFLSGVSDIRRKFPIK